MRNLKLTRAQTPYNDVIQRYKNSDYRLIRARQQDDDDVSITIC